MSMEGFPEPEDTVEEDSEVLDNLERESETIEINFGDNVYVDLRGIVDPSTGRVEKIIGDIDKEGSEAYYDWEDGRLINKFRSIGVKTIELTEPDYDDGPYLPGRVYVDGGELQTAIDEGKLIITCKPSSEEESEANWEANVEFIKDPTVPEGPYETRIRIGNTDAELEVVFDRETGMVKEVLGDLYAETGVNKYAKGEGDYFTMAREDLEGIGVNYEFVYNIDPINLDGNPPITLTVNQEDLNRAFEERLIDCKWNEENPKYMPAYTRAHRLQSEKEE